MAGNIRPWMDGVNGCSWFRKLDFLAYTNSYVMKIEKAGRASKGDG